VPLVDPLGVEGVETVSVEVEMVTERPEDQLDTTEV
jgi:hypothetical protein